MNVSDISQAVLRYHTERLKNWAPPERLVCWEWAERHIVLSEKESPQPGRYRVDVFPYCKGPMECFSDYRIHYVVIVFPAQAGKTINLIVIPMAFDIAQDPCPSALVLPNENMARDFSESRLQTVFDACAPVVAEKPTDDDKYKLLAMHFARMDLNLLGAHSPANLASRPRRKVRADEIDKFPPATEKEADALSLCLDRSLRFWNRQAALTSTPTTLEGNIWRWWKRGDRRNYMIACPHCGHRQKMIMGCAEEYEIFEGVVQKPGGRRENLYRLRWPKDCSISDLDTRAWYQCENTAECVGKIFDGQRKDLIRDAALREDRGWQASRDSRETRGTASFHGNCLMIPDLRMGEIAAEFLRSKRYSDQLQNFYNAWLALPWDAYAQGAIKIDMTAILERPAQGAQATKYRSNQCPPEAVFLTGGIDVQSDRVWFIIRAWGLAEWSGLIAYGWKEIDVDDWPTVVAAVKEIITLDYGKPLVLTGIDSGWGKHTSEVYRLARNVPRLICVKGRRSNIEKTKTGHDIPLPRPKRIDRMPDGTPLTKGPLLYTPSTLYFKDWFLARVRSKASKWHWPEDLKTSKDGAEYKRHIESERKTTKINKTTGKHETFYVVRRGYEANHLLDSEVIASVVLEIVLTAKREGRQTVADIEPLAAQLQAYLTSIRPAPAPPAEGSPASEPVPAPRPPAPRPLRRPRRGAQRHDL